MPIDYLSQWRAIQASNYSIQYAANTTFSYGYMTGGTYANNVTWPSYAWGTSATTNGHNSINVNANLWKPYKPTAAQIAKQTEELRLKRLAERKSKALLREILGDHRYRMFRKDGSVWVESRVKADIAMEIRPGRMIQLHRKVNGVWLKTRGQLCIHPAESYPSGDEVASLYLTAKFDEETIWKTANLHGDPSLVYPELIAA